MKASASTLQLVSLPPRMPGPQNTKRKRAQQKKKHRTRTHASLVAAQTTHCTPSDSPSSPTLVTLLSPTTTDAHKAESLCPDRHEKISRLEPVIPSPPRISYGPPDDPILILLSNPIIHDPGNGPRVRNMDAFLKSSFAQPAWTADQLCAEFAQREILQMLCTVLPEEIALCLWYNKSRRIGRVCPACLRLYTLDDAPPDAPTRLLSEQIISGLCSPICFMLAAYRAPAAAKVAWGRMAEDLDDATWELLDIPEPAQGVRLGMLLKMTRLHDLGLAQLCVPELVVDDGDVQCVHKQEDQAKLEE
ncbi:hypothetical protein B0F90DRAFT_1730547 [Multifurca ochricompacta]|uniref:Uncharacterized protein n=1 Tax=Multifurca ochricompacta TaxID=376703 RepID=A0AAD4QMM5_9AGAM|nr:hypothetical protein B0F90DRAFT_1730547 [Multifurca ochricompacta]